jgi:hypothetical protein
MEGSYNGNPFFAGKIKHADFIKILQGIVAAAMICQDKRY